MPEDQELPVKRITEPLPPIVPAPPQEDQELSAAKNTLREAQALNTRLALLAAQVRLIQRKGMPRRDRYPV